MGFWSENFNSSNLWPIYEAPSTFITSQVRKILLNKYGYNRL